MHARLRGSKSLLILYQNIKKPDFPSLADEIAEPHPDMNTKVAVFTVSEKSSNTVLEFATNHSIYQPLALMVDSAYISQSENVSIA